MQQKSVKGLFSRFTKVCVVLIAGGIALALFWFFYFLGIGESYAYASEVLWLVSGFTILLIGGPWLAVAIIRYIAIGKFWP